MPGINHANAPVVLDIPPVQFREFEFGEYVVTFGEFREDADPEPFFKGLPDDRCQCPHFGYVLEGEISFRFADRVETFHAGDAFYAAPGHTPVVTAGSKVVEFSPAEASRQTAEVMTANLAAAMGAAQ